jgi:hypothetical protein
VQRADRLRNVSSKRSEDAEVCLVELFVSPRKPLCEQQLTLESAASGESEISEVCGFYAWVLRVGSEISGTASSSTAAKEPISCLTERC